MAPEHRRALPVLATLLVGLALGAALFAWGQRYSPRAGGPAPVGGPAPMEALELQSAFVRVADQVRPAVVNIGTVHRTRRPRPFGPEPFTQDPAFKEFFEDFFRQLPQGERQQSSLGSGVVLDKTGDILTNFHVIKGADEITVRLANKKEYRGRVVGTDPKTDLAVVRIVPDEELVTARLGDSDRLRVGEWAIAIGNPFGLDQTVTVGVISATGRSEVGIAAYENFIQTDASINPGNSGGPLLNLKGEVIGINTAIVSTGQGIGFAIPINLARRVAEQLVAKGKVTRGWLGVALQPLTAELAEALKAGGSKGAIVSRVYPGGPAEAAGLQQGDLIRQYGDVAVQDPRHLQRLVADSDVGRGVALRVLRKGRELTLSITVAEMPAEPRPPA
ncbi:MAG: Do family serine endopeptidase [Candidatus Rokubacteria bacterium]|nr:Do family serine endopeptidase [Candidatus Rokubacteria bacterium]